MHGGMIVEGAHQRYQHNRTNPKSDAGWAFHGLEIAPPTSHQGDRPLNIWAADVTVWWHDNTRSNCQTAGVNSGVAFSFGHKALHKTTRSADPGSGAPAQSIEPQRFFPTADPFRTEFCCRLSVGKARSHELCRPTRCRPARKSPARLAPDFSLPVVRKRSDAHIALRRSGN